MRVRDLMTTDLVTVTPEAPIKEAAALMVQHGVSGLVVTDGEGEAAGIVSEADFVKSEANRGARERAGLLRWFGRSSGPEIPGTRVGEIMTSPVITVDPDVHYRAAARIMDRRGVKRLPVLADGRLVGVLSRADIVRAFNRTDKEIRDEIIEELLPTVLWIDPERLDVTVEDGVVALSGRLATKVDVELVDYMTRRVDGVVDITTNLSWEFDPSKRYPEPTLSNPFQLLIGR